MNKQRSLGCWCLAGAILVAFWAEPVSAVQTKIAGVDLQGSVTDAEEKPIEGANIWVYTAGPRVGRGYL